MGPLTWATILKVIIRFWYIPVILLLAFIIYSKNSTIRDLKVTQDGLHVVIGEKQAELKTLKASIQQQNDAIDLLAKKGKDQAQRLDGAIEKVKNMTPATQVIIREIYKDSAKDAQQLLLNALTD